MNLKRRGVALALGLSLMAASFTPKGAFAEELAPIEPTIYRGFENENSDLRMEQIGRYDSGILDGDGGTVEIVAYNGKTHTAYVINGKKQTLSKIPLTSLKDGKNLALKSEADVNIETVIKAQIPDFSYGDMTSVAYHPEKAMIAVAVQAQDYKEAGYVVFFKDEGDTFNYLGMARVGAQPDMVTFNASGSLAITADEGEPRGGYGDSTDPEGSVSLIDTSDFTAKILDFKAFDDKRDELVGKKILLKKDTLPSKDLEPEYVAISGNKAYITLQEANGIAVVDLEKKEIQDIVSAGYVDHSKILVDIDKDDKKYDPKTYDNLRGIAMPDGIAAIELNGENYILIANEGDAREYGEKGTDNYHNNEKESATSPSGKIKTADEVSYFDPSDYDGVDEGVDYLFGGRSFSILKIRDDGALEIYNSGDDFERLTAKYYPDNFNASNDKNKIDNRSDNKGPEPEGIAIGAIGEKTYAFIALERISGIMVYDVTDPAEAHFVNYINSRDFSEKIKDDVSPEGINFVPASDSPTDKPLLLAAMEVSGTLAVYELESAISPNLPEKPENESDFGDWIHLEPVEGGEKPEESEKPEEKPSKTYKIDAFIDGYPDGTFRPERTMSRAEFATIFARIAKLEKEPSRAGDVEDHWAKDAIGAMEKRGWMTGYLDGAFRPDRAMTRAEMAKILAMAEGIEGNSATFNDVDGHWAQAFIGAVEKAGIVKGYPDGGFKPDQTITRAEAVSVLSRLEKRSTRKQDIDETLKGRLKAFQDVPESHWAYEIILDAVNAHTENEDGQWLEIEK